MKQNYLNIPGTFAIMKGGIGGVLNQPKEGPSMPTSDSGKAIASRNATTHGLFARDVVLPSLGEDPNGYRRMQDEWTTQLVPRNLLEQHYVEKIAAASWRLRRLHRWQAQLFEDDGLTEAERLDRLDKVMRHETALHRQIDTAVKMLHKDAPQLYTRRLRDQVLEDLRISDRECREEPEKDEMVELQMFARLDQLRKSTAQAAAALTDAPLDAAPPELNATCQTEIDQVQNCENEPASNEPALVEDADTAADNREKCENELRSIALHPNRVREYLDPSYPYRPPTYHGPPGRKGRRVGRG